MTNPIPTSGIHEIHQVSTPVTTINQLLRARCPPPQDISDQVYFDYKAFDKRFKELLEQVPIKVQLEAAESILSNTLPKNLLHYEYRNSSKP